MEATASQMRHVRYREARKCEADKDESCGTAEDWCSMNYRKVRTDKENRDLCLEGKGRWIRLKGFSSGCCLYICFFPLFLKPDFHRGAVDWRGEFAGSGGGACVGGF